MSKNDAIIQRARDAAKVLADEFMASYIEVLHTGVGVQAAYDVEDMIEFIRNADDSPSNIDKGKITANTLAYFINDGNVEAADAFIERFTTGYNTILPELIKLAEWNAVKYLTDKSNDSYIAQSLSWITLTKENTEPLSRIIPEHLFKSKWPHIEV